MKTYTLIPRDPLLFGDGRPLERARSELWPIPATLAAAINGWTWSGQKAHHLRGPLLARGAQLFVPPPIDALMAAQDTDNVEAPAPWVSGRLDDGRFTYTPPGAPRLDRVLVLDERDKEGRKRARPSSPVLLSDALQWALGQPDDHMPCATKLFQDEARIHVSIDPDTHTASDGLLFRSSGVRLAENVGYAFRWGGAALPAGVVPFGGEGRMAKLASQEGLFPEFEGTTRQLFERKVGSPGLLRVELLTPGWFASTYPTLPRWIDAATLIGVLPGTRLSVRLVAMALDRYRAFSGWMWRDNKPLPRAVRRCVPAGAVYWFADLEGRMISPDSLIQAAKALWLQPLDPLPETEDPNPARLGFGLVLPGFTPSDRAEVLL